MLHKRQADRFDGQIADDRGGQFLVELTMIKHQALASWLLMPLALSVCAFAASCSTKASDDRALDGKPRVADSISQSQGQFIYSFDEDIV